MRNSDGMHEQWGQNHHFEVLTLYHSGVFNPYICCCDTHIEKWFLVLNHLHAYCNKCICTKWWHCSLNKNMLNLKSWHCLIVFVFKNVMHTYISSIALCVSKYELILSSSYMTYLLQIIQVCFFLP